MNEDNGFDRQQYAKRARAFDHVIFASCARRIILQKSFGYYHVVPGTMNPVLRIFSRFLKKVIVAGDAKAFYISVQAFYKFMDLIDCPIPEEHELVLMHSYIYTQTNVAVSKMETVGDEYNVKSKSEISKQNRNNTHSQNIKSGK